MIEIRQTDVFRKWFDSLKDRKTKFVIDVRIRRVSLGNFGDAKPVGEGVSELRIDYGAAFRVYFLKQGNVLVILLCGGDKSTQEKDIEMAYKLVQRIKEK